MPIMNYTTKIDVFKSIGEIQSDLAKHGAKKIMQEYRDNGEPIAISFSIITPVGERVFILPANSEAVYKVLQKQKVKCDMSQANRVAWRILKDWIAAQMAILESGIVEMEQIFLPYMANHTGQTVYQIFKERNLMIEGSEGE